MIYPLTEMELTWKSIKKYLKALIGTPKIWLTHTFVHLLTTGCCRLLLFKIGVADPLPLKLILMTRPYSRRASATKIMQISNHRSIIEKVSDDGVFSWVFPDKLISIRRIVTMSAIRPDIKSGGIMKLENPIGVSDFQLIVKCEFSDMTTLTRI